MSTQFDKTKSKAKLLYFRFVHTLEQ